MGFREDLTATINRYSAENQSNTPDFILAKYLETCLAAYNEAVQDRAKWYGRMDYPAEGSKPYPPGASQPETKGRKAWG